MPSQDYYASNQKPIDLLELLKIVIVFVKIFIGCCLLYIGISLTFWSVEMIELFLKNPNDLPFLNAILSHSPNQEFLKISQEENTLVIEDGTLFRWIMILFILLLLFNVIGRAISAIFKSMITLFMHIDLKSLKPKETPEKTPEKTSEKTSEKPPAIENEKQETPFRPEQVKYT